ncbi:murein transglycosylase A [Methylobacterium organophilum]|uniref:murein transglycosylase A n=1 Tax=Methylobacterium organophilum TaxID=410 RepID=UPI001F13EFE3|nr:murein transglycosylase A [Methylobacterium organophilum]UMY17623.1 murein transglycosylase A [Methylobacterium organophilum]
MARLARYRFAFAAAVCAQAGLATADDTVKVGGALLEPVRLGSLPGFHNDDLGAALDTFRQSCATRQTVPAQLDAAGNTDDLEAACAASNGITFEKANDFFEQNFNAYRILRPDRSGNEIRQGFLTGYFEPELIGSLVEKPGFTTPALARPDDLVSFEQGQSAPGLDPELRAARRIGEGFVPFPTRAEIEDGVLGNGTRPVLWLRDAVDLFVLQVQGSGRVRLPDGRIVRLTYDGKNGRPYTSIGKLIVQEGHLPLEGLTLARWTGWLRAHPQEARRLMRANASYVFFRPEDIADPRLGPPGAAKAPLTPGRSLAVDGGIWRYGLPFWLEGRLPGGTADGRMVIAQDTGSAIIGPARGDLFVGTGEAAGIAAGNLRDAVGFVVLLPKHIGKTGTADAAR